MSQLEDAAKTSTHRFLGLKWKVLLLSSLILIAIVTAFTGITYRSLMKNFENQRLMQHERYTSEVEGLIKQTSQNLHQFAELIPFLEGMAGNLIAGNAEMLAQTFEPYWVPLQLNRGIEVVHFYNHANQLLAKWSSSEAFAQRNNLIRSWVREVNAQEKPSSPLSCDGSCMQFAVVPLLVEGQSVGVVVIGTPLVDAVVGFKNISGADIGLLVKDEGSGAKNNDIKIPNWGIRITILTNREKNRFLLDKVAEDYPDLGRLEQGVQTFWEGRYQQIKLLPLQKINASNKAQLVVITDITSTIETIRNST